MTAAIALLAIVLGSCVDEYQDPLPPRDTMFYPIGVEMHPDGRFLYVINSNFNLRYRASRGGTVLVIDTDTGEVLSESSPYIPSFGAYMALNEDASKLYIPTRHNNELTVLSVAEQGQALYCDDEGERSADSQPCTVRRIPDVRDGARIASDPFDVAVGRTERNVGGETTPFDLVHLTHLRGSAVTSMSLPNADVAGASKRSAALLDRGSNQLEVRPGTNDVYAAGRGTNRVEGFRPFLNASGEVETIVRVNSVSVMQAGSGMDARGLAFDEDGDWMYVATRRPNALHLIGMEPTGGGSPQVVSSIPLENAPSEVHVHQGADGVERLYVPSFRRGIIEVVEPHREAVVDVIDVGRSPYSMASDSRPHHCGEPGGRCQGYVTLFDAASDGESRCDTEARQCGQVAILDLDPDSDTYHTVIDSIE